MKKLLFITTRRFWPADSGRKTSLYFYCRGLHEKYGYNIYVYTFLDGDQTPENGQKMPPFLYDVRYAKPLSAKDKIYNLITKAILGKEKWPLQCSLYFSKENVYRITAYVREIGPDAVIVDMVRLAPYFTAFSIFPCLKILDMDDLLSKRYQRQMTSANSAASIAGAYSSKLPAILNRMISGNYIKKQILKIEASRMKNAELYFAQQYDSVIFVSDFETNDLNNQLGIKKAVTVPTGVDYAYFSEELDFVKEKNTLSYVGNLKIAANIDTLAMIVNDVLPRIKHPVTLRVIGVCPENIREKYKDKQNVVFTGRVDDLRKGTESTSVFLTPIAYGSGIKTKILEAMAMGMPVVTNSIGAEGISAENGVHFYVSDDPSEQAADVDRLLSDPQLCVQIGEAAKEFARQHFCWKDIWNKFSECGL